MLEIHGKFSYAKVFTDIVDETALEQIEQLCNQEFVKGCKIRIMPDVHAGAGCVIGFTADLGEKVIPNIVGVDIGCGMLTVELGKIELDFHKLDKVIRQYVPSGMNVHEGRNSRFPKLLKLHCYRCLRNAKRIERSIGTLGGGNHFIEVNEDCDGNKYLVIHTGSRNLGKQVADLYQKLAIDILKGMDKILDEKNQIIIEYKKEGRKSEIENAIKALYKHYKEKTIDIPEPLCYLEGEYRQNYLDDMNICQEFATLNRLSIASTILDKWIGKEIEDFSHFETIHNYIDHESNIVRKGAVSAKEGEKLIIPINMRDGSLICIGKGNPDWNFSAPHGAGRLFSRTQARAKFSIDEFKSEMEGIFTTSVNESTIDECPMSYKTIDDIVKYISPTVDILTRIKTIYNFKAGD